MSSYVVSDTSLTAVADAIRAKSGENKTLVFPEGFINGISEIKGYTVNEIATGAFGDIIITGTSINKHCFAYSNLTSVVADNVTSLDGAGEMIFARCPNLTSIHMAELTTVANSKSFCGSCPKLKNIYLPKMVSLGDGTFEYCSSLTTVAFPSAWGGYRTFDGCTNLEVVDYGAKSENRASINISNFRGCKKLITLILRGESYLHVLSNINAFSNTPFASGGAGGTIYIPKVLYDELGTGSTLDYKAATNWSTLDGYGTVTWVTIEGSQYETQYADGTPIT